MTKINQKSKKLPTDINLTVKNYIKLKVNILEDYRRNLALLYKLHFSVDNMSRNI